MITPMKPKDNLKLFQKRNKECLWSIKLDGVRVLCEITKQDGFAHDVTWYSGNGKVLFNFHHMDFDVIEYVSPILQYGTVILDGEMTAKDFSHVMTQLRRLKDIDPSIFQYHVFDIPSVGGDQIERLNILDQCKENNQIYTILHQMMPTEGAELQKEAIVKAGYEGIVLKSLDGCYENKRSSHWCKLKAIKTMDAKVVDAVEGVGKHAGKLGAFVCRTDAGKEFKVGTGFTDQEREELWSAPTHKDFHTIEVKYMELTKHGVPRHPVFVRIREDK